MEKLHYIKASDVEHDFCFLEVSRNSKDDPFMDIRISEDRKMSFVIYAEQPEIFLSLEEWSEIHIKLTSFYKDEIENEDQFNSLADSV